MDIAASSGQALFVVERMLDGRWESVSARDSRAEADDMAKAIVEEIQGVQVRVVQKATEDPEGGSETADDEADEQELRILIAEDNDINQRVFIELLNLISCQYDVVENGAEAIAALMRSPFDIVLMDIQMPVMDGITAIKEIRSLGSPISKTPIIAITADAMRGDREKCMAAGADDYIPKPIDSDQLFASIGRCTGRMVAKPEKPATSAVA